MKNKTTTTKNVNRSFVDKRKGEEEEGGGGGDGGGCTGLKAKAERQNKNGHEQNKTGTERHVRRSEA